MAGQERGVPRRDVPQPGLDLLLGVDGEYVLHALDYQGWIRGDVAGDPSRGRQSGVAIVVDVVDETDPLGPRGVDVPAGEGELAQMPLPDDRGEALQTAHVGDDGHPHLTHTEPRVRT